MTVPQRFDLVIVGGGSGGFAAARTARALGASVAIVDPGPLGGLCILRGCMPSKALLASADAAQRVRDADKFGIDAAAPRPNMPAIIQRKRRLIDEFAAYRVEQIQTFPVFSGPAKFIGDDLLEIHDDVLLQSARFVIATGSVIAKPPVLGLSEIGYLTSDDILDLAELPKSVIVLGGGYVACELGQYLHRMGVQTHMVLRAPQVLSSEDTDVGRSLTDALAHEGMEIITDAQIERCERADNGQKVVVFSRGGVEQRRQADEIAMFLGRVPNIDGLHLERVNVRAHAMTGIEVNACMQTSNPAIYAVGDVTGLYPLVHVAIAQGELAAHNALREQQLPIDYRLQKSRTIFTEPQVAVVGDTERELEKAGVSYLAASYPFAEHGKAMTLERTQGFVKILASPLDGKILGAAVIGAEASELIHEMIVAMHFHATVQEFMRIPHLHPTLAEIWTYPAEELTQRIEFAQANTV